MSNPTSRKRLGDHKRLRKLPPNDRQALEKELDALLFAYLKKTTGAYCHLAGKACQCGGPLQPNHLFSRSVRRLRWDELNVIVACSGHNTWAHYHQTEWNELWRNLYPKRAAALDLRRMGTMKMDTGTLKMLIAHYRGKLT